MEYQVIVSMTVDAASCLISRFPDFLCNGKNIIIIFAWNWGAAAPWTLPCTALPDHWSVVARSRDDPAATIAGVQCSR